MHVSKCCNQLRQQVQRINVALATMKISLGMPCRAASLSRTLRPEEIMEAIKSELGVGTIKELRSRFTGGCINRAKAYNTDKYGDIFVKFNDNEKAQEMFDGEFAALQALLDTNTIRVPKPIKVFSINNDCCLAMEFIDMHGPSDSEKLGTSIAKLHLHNKSLIEASKRSESTIGSTDKQPKPIEKFGFDILTYSGYCPLINEWSDNWVEFYSQNRLKKVIEIVVEKSGDRDLLSLWPKLERKIPEYFKNCDIYPCLLHGDLWSGNYSFTKDGPVVFDPASFYGHSEYEFGILTMFGGFDKAFHTAYHKMIPQTTGFTQRVLLYQLFHHLNHWNHFGARYKQGALNLMQKLS
uniref:protein-ribulosamine 3-kinase n=1 Tax=Elaeophora elaphi TaxID=1147741 RepID=A0A0R3RZP1_9BILA